MNQTQVDSTDLQFSESPQHCYLGLGSNLSNELGSPIEHIQGAIGYLKNHPQVSNVTMSSLYESLPMGPQDQPDYINAVVGCDTTLSPFELLALCQSMEQQANRVRLRHWGERSLDVDILLYGDKEIHTDTLTVPHPMMNMRNFVLIPLLELSPDLEVASMPIKNKTAAKDWTGLKKIS